MYDKKHIKFFDNGIEIINIIKNRLLNSKCGRYQSLIKENDNFYYIKKEYRKIIKKKLNSGIGLNNTGKKYSFMKVSDKGSSQKSILMKILSHIPIFSCILCSEKVSKCDDNIIDKKLQTKVALKRHFELYKHPHCIPSDEVFICKRSNISEEVSFNSQSIQFLDDDIMDHVNYLTHPIYLFH